MAIKTLYRAVRIDGFVYGGGGSHFHFWRRTWKQAKADLDAMKPSYDDTFGCVEASKFDETRAFEMLRTQGR